MDTARCGKVLGSALVTSAGDGVSPSRSFPVEWTFALEQRMKESPFRRNAETNMRDACATRAGPAPRLWLTKTICQRLLIAKISSRRL